MINVSKEVLALHKNDERIVKEIIDVYEQIGKIYKLIMWLGIIQACVALLIYFSQHPGACK